jgi:hypothetical protein
MIWSRCSLSSNSKRQPAGRRRQGRQLQPPHLFVRALAPDREQVRRPSPDREPHGAPDTQNACEIRKFHFRRAAEYGLLQIILTVVLLMKSSTAFFTHLRGQRLQCQTLSTSAQLNFCQTPLPTLADTSFVPCGENPADRPSLHLGYDFRAVWAE